MSAQPFLTALPLYKPANSAEKRLLEGAEVLSMTINREQRSLSLTVLFKTLPEYGKILSISRGLCAAYALNGAEIITRLPREAFCESFTPFFLDYICAVYPGLCGFFLKGEYAFSEGRLSAALPAGSAAVIKSMDAYPDIKRWLSEVFGCAIALELSEVQGEDPEKKLDEYAEKLLESMPAPPAPKPVALKAEPEKPRRVYAPRAPKPEGVSDDDVLMGRPFGEESMKMADISGEMERVAVCGEVFSIEQKLLADETRMALVIGITDRTGSVYVRRTFSREEGDFIASRLKEKSVIRVRGSMIFDRYTRDIILRPTDIYLIKKQGRKDTAEKKRVELHMHTNMSALDGVASAADLVKRAKEFGFPAVAITDHGVTQGFPDAMHAADGIKILYGTEGYYVYSLPDLRAVSGLRDQPLKGEFVCFDLETTGTDPRIESITEISAVLVKNGCIADEFHTYVHPRKPIPPYITELTGITNEMVAGAPSDAEAVRALKEFCGERVLVAHNAAFDVGFVNAVCAREGIFWEITSIDTLELSRVLLPDLDKHKLDYVARGVGLGNFRHHSASDDARVLAGIFINFLNRLEKELGIEKISEINQKAGDLRRERYNKTRVLPPVRHIILIARNAVGLKNLYKLVSLGHIKYMDSRKRQIMPRHEIEKHREGLLIGSACEAGELYRAVLEGKSHRELREIARFYDFLEIQPAGNNEFLIREGTLRTIEEIQNINQKIVALGKELGIPVVATGDVHFLDPEDEVYRRIIMAGKGFEDADMQAPLFLKTTNEMLEEFSYLGAETAYKVVVENTNLIAEMCEEISPVPKGMFPPELKGSAEELTALTYAKAHALYGETLPEIVKKRVERELKPIIANGFDVMYMIAQKLIKRSNESGYLVGSRGSVGSSVVAFFAGITEINALPPHYRCPKCRYSEFHPGEGLGCGLDLPDKACPACGEKLVKDGFDIPFETFLGFDGDKAPDIDLNFSGEEDQAAAHHQTTEMFGKDNVFRAGTIGTLGAKPAFGYVHKYCESRGIVVSKAEEERLIKGCMDVKKTTGQHPGGLIIVPQNKEIYDFCPIQYPADDPSSGVFTTHVDYHSIDANLLKLDLLGKDDPTILRYLEDVTGVRVEDIPLDDPEVMELFLSNRPLGIESDEITGPNGALGIPEYGTGFVRGMLAETNPRTISDLVRISGLSHGTDVWLGNARDLILKEGKALKDCICCRDDIMEYLISVGIESKLAFAIMETVRKPRRLPNGKKLKDEWEEKMRAAGVPEWYINSCNKIAYLFPKAHAAAYVVMALRIAWFKVHKPLAYYGSFFGIKAAAFDAEAMLSGETAVKLRLSELAAKGKAATDREKEIIRTLEITHEYLLRGFKFLPVDLYKSEPRRFTLVPEENALRMPLMAVTGLGEVAAAQIAEEREKGEFTSKEDLARRASKLSSTIIAELDRIGALGDMPESAQAGLFY